MNAWPTVAVVVAALVIKGAGGLATTVRVCVPVPPALLAEIVMVLVPAAVGAPEIRPVAVLILNPAGKPVALKLVGALFAVIW